MSAPRCLFRGVAAMLTTPADILIVDDEKRLRASLAELFASEGHRVLEAGDGDEALTLLRQATAYPDVILLDLKMPNRDGLATLKELKQSAELKSIPVVIITAFGSSEQTISAMKGAHTITSPSPLTQARCFGPPHVPLRCAASARSWSVYASGSANFREEDEALLIGRHPSMREVFKLIGKVATSDAAVLITGESGTGKGLVAQTIHRHSPRADRPLVTINCGAIPEGLLESELFGHERGAFTGAVQSKQGRIELAKGGTVFLDEIGDLPSGIQVKLLRVLQEHTFERLGGNQSIHVDFRLITATNRDLAQLMHDGRFREDLFYRLNVVRLELPPLRARRSDIPELAEHFLRRYGTERAGAPSGISDEAPQGFAPL